MLEADPPAVTSRSGPGTPTPGSYWPTGHGLLALAADARTGLPAEVLPRYAQPTTWGVPVVPGPLSAQATRRCGRCGRRSRRSSAAWHGTAIADLGRLQPGNPAIVGGAGRDRGAAADPGHLEGLYHLRERVKELAHTLGDPSRAAAPGGGGGDRPAQGGAPPRCGR